MIPGYSIVLIAASIVTALLAASTGWHRRQAKQMGTWVLLLLIAITLYLFGYGMELASTELAGMLLWSKVQYFGIAWIPPLLLFVVFGYTDMNRHLSLEVIAVLSIIPVITLALVLTQNPLYYHTVGVDTSAPFPRLAFTPGLWYLVNSCNLFISQLVGTVLLARAYHRSTQKLFRRQLLILGIGLISPFVAFIAYVAGLSPIPHLDPIPFALIITGAASVVGIFSFHLFDLIPIAHSVILQKIPVGVMVVDDQNRVTEVNPAAETMLGLAPGEGIGRPAAHLADRFPELSGILASARPGVEEEVVHEDLHLTFEVVPLGDGGDRPNGSVLLIRDISLRRQAEEALLRRTGELEVANRQLALISAITRHDISNQLVAIGGYLDLLLDDGMPVGQAGTVIQIQNATERVGRMVAFMRDYQAIGTQAPVWTDLRFLAEEAATGVALGGVRIDCIIPAGIEVLADPLVEKVIATLFENAVRHGENVTTIRLSAETNADGLTFVCEDDGVGVDDEMKERIFERGIGSNTGLGLFLAREILAITGMTIAETGVAGVGARFEIRVPNGRFRIPPRPSGDRGEGLLPVHDSMTVLQAGHGYEDTPA